MNNLDKSIFKVNFGLSEGIFPGFGYTGGQYVWVDRPFYLVKWPQEKWACDFHYGALPFSFQLQATEDFFKSHNFFIVEK